MGDFILVAAQWLGVSRKSTLGRVSIEKSQEGAMKMQAKLISVVGAAVIACSLGVAVAQSKKEPVFVESEKAEFKEVVPGVRKKILWGNDDVGPYGAFTKFDPGITNPLHTHTNEVRIVVLRGAYIYKPQNGKERRVSAGSYISIPGGDVHVSSGDAKEGALFYEESPGKFDLKLVDQKGKK
jgi:quercetin dioxygenase-like cupin family protein